MTDDAAGGPQMSKFLYTVSNRQSANSVIGMEIQDTGDLRFLPGSPFVTGGKGSRSSQSQNGVWIDGDLLYAVDFGSSSFAIFRKQSDGTLTRTNNSPIDSHGISPCSLCVSNGILYVVNQHIRSSGGKAEPNLAVFEVKGPAVRFLEKSSFPFARGESPTQAIVNPQGTLLAIPSVKTRRSLLHCYRIERGSAGPKLTELETSPFSITDSGFGFGSVWKSDGKTLFMTNATGTGSVVRLDVDIKSGRITEKARATTPGNACWTALSPNGRRLYVANLLSLLVFDVSGNRLDQIQNLDVTDAKGPVLRDLILGPGGKFLYAIEQRKRRILIYAVDATGRVTRSGELALGVPGHTLGLALD
jgi:6-phosphogluconolactonase (cycloisomerase 2 family)